MTKIKAYHFGVVILLIGIIIRFYYQFIEWSFNDDEINLGNNILDRSFIELLYPLDNGQSAPPLFLWMEKIISKISKPFISLKILTFLSSIFSLFLFNRIIKKNYSNALYLALIIIFTFNPFILYNSLTLKQYSLDLMLSLIAVIFFIQPKKYYQNYLFFTFWCLLSNIGLLFAAAFSFFHFLKLKRDSFTRKEILNILSYITAPFLYLIYFLWFMQQKGSRELKNYMVNYWKDSFLPLNFDVFKWIALQGNAISFYLFSSYLLLGIPMLVFFLIGFYSVCINIRKRKFSSLTNIVSIYIIAISIHLILSTLKFYPFSGRIYLYIAPVIILIFGEGIKFILLKLKISHSKVFYFFPILLLLSYLTYLPFRDNDVLNLIKYLKKNEIEQILVTKRSKTTISNWILFTGFSKIDNIERKIVPLEKGELNPKDLIISRQSHKFGHKERSSKPEKIILDLLSDKTIRIKKKLDGYTIYEIK